MSNIGNIIKSHNTSILNPDKTQENLEECSCRNKDSSPLDSNNERYANSTELSKKFGT